MSDSPYKRLVQQLRRAYFLEHTLGLLDWDQQVNLPSGSADFRAEQTTIIAALHHREISSPVIADALEELENNHDSLSADQRVVVQGTRRDYNRAIRLPARFIIEKTEHQSKAYHAWTRAREENDFSCFVPFLKKTLALAREEAANAGHEDAPYDYHLDQHDPGMTTRRVEALFNALRPELLELVGTLLQSPGKNTPFTFRKFPVSDQQAFIREVAGILGFDFRHGRIDRSLHPFCAGDGNDTRMTTHLDPDKPLDALFSAIHETGHALYSQGLPRDCLSNPLGQSAGMAIHESQSRLWENQVGRGRNFWAYFEPRLRKKFPSQLAEVSSEDLYRSINNVKLQSVRVDSDEVTYNLHILLRFELEKALFDESLSVEELPQAWNDLSRSLIGVMPENHSSGVLQDIHWCGGAFGYFPSYCVGNMIAAQLWYQVKEEIPGLENEFSQGRFESLLTWLRMNIHQHGRRYNTEQLVENVTGSPINPKWLLRYLRERYLPLYQATGKLASSSLN